MTITGEQLFHEWQETGHTKAQVGAAHGLTYGQAAGRIWRWQQAVKHRLPAEFPVYYKPLGAPWTLTLNSFMALADVQLPHVDETWLDLACMIAERHLLRPRTLLLAGDLVNLDAFSDYDPTSDLPELEDEIGAAQAFFGQILQTFDDVFWFWGNHERRASRKTKNALKPHILGRLILGGTPGADRVQLSHWGYCFVDTSRGGWIVAHGKNYSVQRLNVAEWLAWKYQRHVVSFHEHHLAQGYDRYGHYQIVNGGGLFKQSEMAYSVLDASKSPNMVNGFVLFKDGYAHALGPDGFTDWRLWLPDSEASIPVRRRARAEAQQAA